MDEKQSEKRTGFVSLRVKLLVGFTLLFTVVFAGAFYWFSDFAERVALRRIHEDLKATLEAAAAGVDGDELIALYQEGEPREDGFTDDPRYWRQLEWLDTVHGIEPRAWPYSYVEGDRSEELIFITDLYAKYDPTAAVPFGYSCYNDPECGDPDPNLQALADRTVLEKEPYTDKWGSWISGYAPIKNSKGEVVAGLGIDFKADYVDQVKRAVRNQVWIAFGITYTTLFILVFLVSGTLSRPIVTLTKAAERIGEGDYEQDLSHLIKDRFPDEIDTLAKVFGIMVSKVYQREQTLIRRVEELRIEIDEVKRRKQVSEIVETDFFQDLQAKARRMRSRGRSKAQDTPGGQDRKSEPL
jgi:hypothetical protein